MEEFSWFKFLCLYESGLISISLKRFSEFENWLFAPILLVNLYLLLVVLFMSDIL